jgi:signal transduction histidine kinase
VTGASNASTEPDSRLGAPPKYDLQRMLDGLTDAAVVVDGSLRPIAWNRAYVEMTGLRPRRFLRTVETNEVRCRDFVELSVCDDNCLVKRTFASGRPVRMDELSARSVRVQERASNVFIVSTIPLEGDDGQLVAAVEIYRDVTAENRIQTRYKALLEKERSRAETLEEQVKARTADLEQSVQELKRTRDQLIQSEKMSSLGRLVAGLAHELNNPINYIQGNASFLDEYVTAYKKVIDALEASSLGDEDRRRVAATKKEADIEFVDEDIGKVIEAISAGSTRAAGIIQDLRKFIHGGYTAINDEVRLMDCVSGTVNLVKHEVRDRIAIELQGEEDVPVVRGNQGQLNQVFMNLLVNAVEAIDDRGAIDVVVAPAAGGAVVEVRDDGPGISAEHMDRVFEPFFTTKPVGKGTGLGLSISYSIVEAHRGTLSVAGRPEGGTVFRLWLPAHATEDVGASSETGDQAEG